MMSNLVGKSDAPMFVLAPASTDNTPKSRQEKNMLWIELVDTMSRVPRKEQLLLLKTLTLGVGTGRGGGSSSISGMGEGTPGSAVAI